jgi:hypothetical protein
VSGKAPGLRKISKAEYDSLCRQACEGYSTRTTSEAMWFAVCKKVYHHLHGYKQDLVFPYQAGPRQEIYESFLRRVVGAVQSEDFDPVELAWDHIDAARHTRP